MPHCASQQTQTAEAQDGSQPEIAVQRPYVSSGQLRTLRPCIPGYGTVRLADKWHRRRRRSGQDAARPVCPGDKENNPSGPIITWLGKIMLPPLPSPEGLRHYNRLADGSWQEFS